MWSRRVSAVIRACSLASAAARVPAAASSTRSFSNTHSIYGSAPTFFGDSTAHIARTTPQQSGQHGDSRDRDGHVGRPGPRVRLELTTVSAEPRRPLDVARG